MTNTAEASRIALVNKWIKEAIIPRVETGAISPANLRYSFSKFKEKNTEIDFDILDALYLAWETELLSEVYEILEAILPTTLTLFTNSMDFDVNFAIRIGLFKSLIAEKRKEYKAQLNKPEATTSV